MKTIVLFLVIAVTLAVNCSAQTVTTEKKLRPRAPHMPVRQTEIDKALGLKEPHRLVSSISPTRVSVQESGEPCERPIYRTPSVNGGKEEVSVAKTVWSVNYTHTNSVQYTPQMVDGKPTAKAQSVTVLVPLKPLLSLPKK